MKREAWSRIATCRQRLRLPGARHNRCDPVAGAHAEAILLDPVYTGKGMAGLIDLINRGRFKRGQAIVFLRAGGRSVCSAI